MLQKLVIPLDWKKLSDILEKINVRNEIKQLSFNPNKLNSRAEIEAVFTELGGNKADLPFNITFQLLYLFQHDIYIMLEPAYHFNKYRLITFRAGLYEDQPINFDLLKFKNFCRTKNEDAIKSGLAPEIWEDELGTNLFGPSESPGYFGGNGSSGWKYIAFTNYLLDVYLFKQKSKFFRFSLFDNLMTHGKISTIGNLLAKTDPDSMLAIQKYFTRSLSLEMPIE